jgi:hypothetical protein
MKRFAAGILLLALPVCTACSTTTNRTVQTSPEDRAEAMRAEEANNQRAVNIILFPFAVALSPLILVGFAAHGLQSQDQNPPAKSKSAPPPPVNPLPQTS